MDIAANLNRVHQTIQAACARVGRDPASVLLLPVTKSHPPDTVRAAAEAGLTVFGENRVQEAKLKMSLCPGSLRWHLIGHLQSNKCRDAAHCFAMVQSVDRWSLAEELNKWADKFAKTLPILLEVNVAGESSKFGFPPDQVLRDLERINALPHLEIHGLMTMAPWTPDGEKVRPVFRKLRELKEQCEARLGVPLPHLSMGTSDDYPVAIEEGATLIRLGTALFGARTAKTWKPTAPPPPE